MLRRRWKHCQLRQTDKLELGEAEFQWRSWLTWQNFPQFWRTHHNWRKTSKVIMQQQIVMKPEPKQFPINLLSKDNHIKNSDHARDQNCAKKNTQLQSSWNPVDTWKLDGSMRWLPFSYFKGPTGHGSTNLQLYIPLKVPFEFSLEPILEAWNLH